MRERSAVAFQARTTVSSVLSGGHARPGHRSQAAIVERGVSFALIGPPGVASFPCRERRCPESLRMGQGRWHSYPT